MNLLPMRAVVVFFVAACAGSPPTATQPVPTSSPLDTLTPSPTAVPASSYPDGQPTPSGTAASPDTVVVGADEAWIAFQWVDGSGDGIFLVRPDGTGHHQLVPDMTGSEIHPDWSPDGVRIAFVRQAPEGPVELWMVDADGTDAERLYSCELPCNEIHYPDWSPDGSSIYFSQNSDVPPGEVVPRTFSIGRFDITERTAHLVISRDDGVETWQGRVSPDGTTLAYMAGSEALGGTAIFVSPLAGGPATQITEYEMLGAHPDWTRDGRIVFQTHDLAIFPSLTEPANLFIMDADGGNLEQMTQFEESGLRAAQPRVAPDGSGIAFTHVEGPGMGTRRMAFLPFGHSEPRWLTPNPMPGTHPQLRPTRTAMEPAGPQGLFDVGDRSLYIECVGRGSPTFIVETGEGMPIEPMNGLRDALGERGLACSYDRANKGRSGTAPVPRSGLDVVSDLNALLAAASIPGPYVLVGHSAGGVFVQLYAKQYPDDVIGVVAMNPVPPFDAVVAEIFPDLPAEEVEAETSYYEGQNGESLDYAAASETVDSLPAPDVPFELLISTSEQCGGHEGCLRTYPIFEGIMSDLADSWPQGNVTQIDTGHDLFLRQDEVLEVVDSVLARTER